MTGGKVDVVVGVDGQVVVEIGGAVDQVADVALDKLGVREGKDKVVEGAGLKGGKVKPNFFFPAALVGGGGGTT